MLGENVSETPDHLAAWIARGVRTVLLDGSYFSKKVIENLVRNSLGREIANSKVLSQMVSMRR